MKDKIGNIGKIVSVILLFIGVYAVWKHKKNLNSSLLKNKYIVGGVFTGAIDGIKNNGITLIFRYHYKGIEYNGSSSGSRFITSINDRSKFENKIFPVIVDTTYPENSDILITKRKFREYECAFPDSLNWTLEYLE